nr:lysophospholipid acyltransferase family protein [Candidatus Protofrankia californiensis]
MSEARIIPLGSKDARIRAGGGAAERRSRPQGPSDGDHDDPIAVNGANAGESVDSGHVVEYRMADDGDLEPHRDDPTASATVETGPERSGGQRRRDGGSSRARGAARRASSRLGTADTKGTGDAGVRGSADSGDPRESPEFGESAGEETGSVRGGRLAAANRAAGTGRTADVDGTADVDRTVNARGNGGAQASKGRAGVSGRHAPSDDSGAGQVSALPSEPLADAGSLERALAGFLAFLRRRITGDYVVDEHGFDQDLTENVIAPLLRPIYQNYFRIETRGLENIPDTGGALIVANHSGTLPLDAIMTSLAIMDHHPAHRHLRILAADLVFSVPFLAPMARKTGNTLACQADAERLLAGGHLVGVWPEGFKGIGKPFSERYKLQRFGRGGFVSAALRTGVPIIPCTIVGAEETYPMIGNLRTLARLLGLPYLPITPTFPWLGILGLIPLPSKWFIEFGEPVDTESPTPTPTPAAAAAEDPMLVFELTDRIRETIQHSLYGLLMQRRSVFF